MKQATLLGLFPLIVLLAQPATPTDPGGDKIPITTSSEAAKKEFLAGRELADNLKATDAIAHFDKALELDPNFASAELARANGIRVVLASVMPVCDYVQMQTDRRPPEKIVALNTWIKAYAAKNNFVYLDYYSATVDEKKMFKRELTYDGLHPNDAGYDVMAPLAEKAIALALQKNQ